MPVLEKLRESKVKIVSIPKICTNKFFLMAISGSFAFTLLLFNIANAASNDVKENFFSQNDEIKEKIEINTQKIENILISQARIEQKIDNLTP